MKRNNVLASILAAACFMVIGCGQGNNDYRLVELAEAKTLRAWIDGGLKDQAEKKAPEWRAALETSKLLDKGPIKISKAQRTLGFIRWMEAMEKTENAQNEALSMRVAAMKRGEYVPEKGELSPFLNFIGKDGKDGKTPEQRTREYQPRIETEMKAAEAHRKAALAFKEAVQELKKLNG